MKLWDVHFYQPLTTFNDYNGAIKFMLFTPDGNALITANQDKTGSVTSIKLRRAATREDVAQRRR